MPGFLPLGGDALGATGEAAPVDIATDTLVLDDTAQDAAQRALEALVFGDTLAGTAAAYLSAGIYMDDFTATELIQRILERLAVSGTPLPATDARPVLTDEAAFGDAMVLVWQALATENIELVGTAVGNRALVAALVDSLHATGAVSSRLDAMAAVSAAIAINTLLAGGWQVAAIDTVEFQDALTAQLRAMGKLVDSAGFADGATAAARITVIGADTLALADDLASTLEAFALLAEEVVFYATIRLGAAEYAGWVLSQGAVWEYRNYPFNGFVEVAGRYFGTADTGLFELAGTDDDGTPIEGRIRTALLDFGTGKNKRVPDVYIAFAGGNQVVLKTITTDPKTGAVRTDIYTADVPPGDGLHNGRVKVGRGLASRYWQFELTNVASQALEIDELAFRPLILDRRL